MLLSSFLSLLLALPTRFLCVLRPSAILSPNWKAALGSVSCLDLCACHSSSELKFARDVFFSCVGQQAGWSGAERVVRAPPPAPLPYESRLYDFPARDSNNSPVCNNSQLWRVLCASPVEIPLQALTQGVVSSLQQPKKNIVEMRTPFLSMWLMSSSSLSTTVLPNSWNAG